MEAKARNPAPAQNVCPSLLDIGKGGTIRARKYKFGSAASLRLPGLKYFPSFVVEWQVSGLAGFRDRSPDGQHFLMEVDVVPAEAEQLTST
jgi:hypothetical protein